MHRNAARPFPEKGISVNFWDRVPVTFDGACTLEQNTLKMSMLSVWTYGLCVPQQNSGGNYRSTLLLGLMQQQSTCHYIQSALPEWNDEICLLGQLVAAHQMFILSLLTIWLMKDIPHASLLCQVLETYISSVDAMSRIFVPPTVVISWTVWAR